MRLIAFTHSTARVLGQKTSRQVNVWLRLSDVLMGCEVNVSENKQTEESRMKQWNVFISTRNLFTIILTLFVWRKSVVVLHVGFLPLILDLLLLPVQVGDLQGGRGRGSHT